MYFKRLFCNIRENRIEVIGVSTMRDYTPKLLDRMAGTFLAASTTIMKQISLYAPSLSSSYEGITFTVKRPIENGAPTQQFGVEFYDQCLRIPIKSCRSCISLLPRPEILYLFKMILSNRISSQSLV